MPAHKVAMSITAGSDSFIINQTVTDAQARAVDAILAASTTNSEVDIVLTRADVKSLVLSCIGGDLTIKTNSTSEPGDTVVMTAGEIIYWSASQSGVQAIGTDPFSTADVTKLYLSSTAGTTFALRAIVTSANG